MRRIALVLIVLLLLGAGLFRVGQLLRVWTTSSSSSSKPSSSESIKRPTAYTPASGPVLRERDVPGLTSIDDEYTKLVEAVLPSVVSITSQRVTQIGASKLSPLDVLMGRNRGAGREQVETSLGSGVIVSKEGHVLTNHHVIEGMSQIEVQLADQRAFPATVLGSDADVDLAVLKITAPDLKPLPLGESDRVRVGQLVFAIGNPFGLSETVTAGIVSAKGRRAMRDSTVEYLQTDAAVNHGNSGGPLINLRGEIVGINSAIYSSSEDGGWLGISFAIPSNIARRAVDSVIKRGRIVRGYLGIQMDNLTPQQATRLKAGTTQGAYVAVVQPNSPAARAGLKPGDVIRTFAGRPVADPQGLRSRLNEVDVGEKVELGFVRNGSEARATAEIGEAPPDSEIRPNPSRK